MDLRRQLFLYQLQLSIYLLHFLVSSAKGFCPRLVASAQLLERVSICQLLGSELLSRSCLAIYPLRRNAAHECIATTSTQIHDSLKEMVI